MSMCYIAIPLMQTPYKNVFELPKYYWGVERIVQNILSQNNDGFSFVWNDKNEERQELAENVLNYLRILMILNGGFRIEYGIFEYYGYESTTHRIVDPENKTLLTDSLFRVVKDNENV